MFWVRIRLGGREYLGVLDTGATISIVAKKILPCGSLKNTMTTAAIRMRDGHVVHSCGDCEVEVPMGSRTIAHWFYVMDTEAFDFVLGTDFFAQHSQIQSLTLQAPYLLYVDHGSGRESVPLEQSEHTSPPHQELHLHQRRSDGLDQEEYYLALGPTRATSV